MKIGLKTNQVTPATVLANQGRIISIKSGPSPTLLVVFAAEVI